MRDKMYYMGNAIISPQNFNPNILYLLKEKVKDNSSMPYPPCDFIVLIHVLSGSCTYVINDIPYKVKKGDTIILNPGFTHRKLLNYGDEVTEINVGFNNITITNLPKDHLISENQCPIIHMTKYRHEFVQCCEEIMAEREKHEPCYELVLKSLTMKLISLFLKEFFAHEKCEAKNALSFESSDRASIVKSIIDYINKNYMKEISLERISKNMYFSAVYISKIFKEETGDSPINYLIKVRLSRAREMLEAQGASIKAAAKSVGYHDAYYFSKLFKKYYGYSPSKLVKNPDVEQLIK